MATGPPDRLGLQTAPASYCAGEATSVPLELEVLDFGLPGQMTAKTMLALGYGDLFSQR